MLRSLRSPRRSTFSACLAASCALMADRWAARAAQTPVAESLQIGSLIEELKTEYRMLASSSGVSGSSREKLLIQRVEDQQKEISPLQEVARKLIEERAQLLPASEDELTQLLSKFDGYLVQVLRIKDSLDRELAATAGDNRIHRERRIKAPPRHQ